MHSRLSLAALVVAILGTIETACAEAPRPNVVVIITDDQGTPDGNMKLSESRAFAVKAWLEKQSPTNFPEGRVKVLAHGQTEPVVPNSSAENRAKNRRVVIVLGTSS